MDKIFTQGNQKYILGGLIVLILLIIGAIFFFDNIKELVIKSPNLPETKNTTYSPITSGPLPTLNPKVTCARFKNIEQALKYPVQTCILDLTGQNLSALPKDLSSLVHLTTIILNNNKFEEFPPQLLTLTQLVEIDMANNMITKLPEDISKLKKLEKLDLSNNKLTSLPNNSDYLNSIGSFLLVGNNINTADRKRVRALYKTPPPINLQSLPTIPASSASNLK